MGVLAAVLNHLWGEGSGNSIHVRTWTNYGVVNGTHFTYKSTTVTMVIFIVNRCSKDIV